MMKPEEFFKTAELLKDKTEESHIRTSIGRSYYATLLYFREYLEKLGLKKTVKPNNEVHAFVIQCLSNSENKTAMKVSESIHMLQQRRTDADYHLDKELTNNDANLLLGLGRMTISNYHKNIAPQEERDFIEKAKDFARRKPWI